MEERVTCQGALFNENVGGNGSSAEGEESPRDERCSYLDREGKSLAHPRRWRLFQKTEEETQCGSETLLG